MDHGSLSFVLRPPSAHYVVLHGLGLGLGRPGPGPMHDTCKCSQHTASAFTPFDDGTMGRWDPAGPCARKNAPRRQVTLTDHGQYRDYRDYRDYRGSGRVVYHEPRSHGRTDDALALAVISISSRYTFKFALPLAVPVRVPMPIHIHIHIHIHLMTWGPGRLRLALVLG